MRILRAYGLISPGDRPPDENDQFGQSHKHNSNAQLDFQNITKDQKWS